MRVGALGCECLLPSSSFLDFTLTAEQMDTLTAIGPLPRQYPHTFWNDAARNFVYGRRAGDIDVDGRPTL